MQRLENRTAVITGGARGIGAAIAEAYAVEGADVVIADVLAKQSASEVLRKIEAAGQRCVFVEMDVAKERDVRGMVQLALAEFDHIDILVNNAGIVSQSPLETLAVDEWDRVVATNLRGVFLCTRFILPYMLEQGEGWIINIASQLGQIGGAEMAHYCASKGGVIAFTKALAREVSRRNIHVNAIAPGPTLTDMVSEPRDDWMAAKLAQLPIGRIGYVDEIAPCAVFLASRESSFFVGQCLGPNGGDVML